MKRFIVISTYTIIIRKLQIGIVTFKEHIWVNVVVLSVKVK